MSSGNISQKTIKNETNKLKEKKVNVSTIYYHIIKVNNGSIFFANYIFCK